MSDTPRTDKVRRTHILNCPWVHADYMEELEREFTAAPNENEEAKMRIKELKEEIEQLKEDLAAAIQERNDLLNSCNELTDRINQLEEGLQND